MSDSLFTWLSRAGRADPGATFLTLPSGDTLSYGAMLARTARMANLLGKLNVTPGDRVAAHVDKSPEALFLYLATIRAGAVFLPLNSAYTPDELAHFLSDAEPTLFVCASPTAPQMISAVRDARIGRMMTLDVDGGGSFSRAADKEASEYDDVRRAAGDLAAILYTSGTTGRSKGAMLTQRNLASNADALRGLWRITAEDRLLHALPIYHTHGLFVATNTIMAAGASIIFLARFDAQEAIAQLPQASMMMGIPTFYSRLLDSPGFSARDAGHMRLFISGSAPMSAELHRQFEGRTGHAIVERYGMTETSIITSNPCDGPRIAGRVGPALPDIEVRIADLETGVPTDDIGVIEVRGPNVFSGYWRMPEKTAQEFRDDRFFITGDLGRIDAAGYVHIVGRNKDLVISGGLNVYPAEVEDVIDALPGVAESAVIGVPHRDMGEAVVAIVRIAAGSVLTQADVGAALNGRLARFKQPRAVIFVDDMPRNTMGKIQKNLLRETHAALFDAAPCD